MSIAKDVKKEETLRYERHQPEQTLLYQIIEKYYPQFLTHMAQQDTDLPMYVRSEFEEYLKCGRLEHGFLRVRCESCHNEWQKVQPYWWMKFCHMSLYDNGY